MGIKIQSGKWGDTTIGFYLDKAQDIITNCIDDGFIGEDQENQSLIYLSNNGTKFASFFGFLVEFVERFGKTWSFFIGILIIVIPLITAIITTSVVGFVDRIIPWIMNIL